MQEGVRAHVFVSGMVQGVFFRQRMAERARSRGVSGWVRNLPDGRVEAILEGSRETVESLIRWCHDGPRFAQVESVEVEWDEARGESGFATR